MMLIVTENGWSNIIYDYMHKFNYGWWVPIFFNSFYSIIKFVILSLLVGLIWEIFLIISEHIEKKPGSQNAEKQNPDGSDDGSEDESVDESLDYDFEKSKYFETNDLLIGIYREKLYKDKGIVDLEDSLTMERDDFTDESGSSRDYDREGEEANVQAFFRAAKQRAKSSAILNFNGPSNFYV